MITYRKIAPMKYALRGGGKSYMTPIRPQILMSIFDDKQLLLSLSPSGMLLIAEGYMWDGASGPTVDGPTNMEPALKHDAFYHLMAAGLLPQSFRKAVDKLFYKDLLVAGMFKPRAWYYYQAVRLFGGKSAKVRDRSFRDITV